MWQYFASAECKAGTAQQFASKSFRPSHSQGILRLFLTSIYYLDPTLDMDVISHPTLSVVREASS